MKVTELISGLKADEKFFCCEFFPPKTSQGLENLIDRARRLYSRGALFVSVTWGAGGSNADTTLNLATRLQKDHGIPTVLHLTCTNMDKSLIDKALQAAAEAGIENILALRGDPPRSDYSQSSDFVNAADLVKYIRGKHGDAFCIGVAGYPEGHASGAASEQSVDRDLIFLEAKVRAGADFIITQLFYDPQVFIEYQRILVEHPSGVFENMPIIPGVMPINTYPSFLRSAKLSHASIPDSIMKRLDQFNVHDDEEIKRVGIEIVSQIVGDLTDAGVRGVHFYTLNLEKSVTQIIEKLGLESNSVRDSLTEWDDFTNGRYTDPSSAAFGEIDGYGPIVHGANDGSPLENWGPIKGDADVSQLFIRHITNEIEIIPFSDEPLSAETGLIQEELINMNLAGMWTLASQPAANAAPSTDRIFGWGPPDGKIFQREFVEFFATADAWRQLKLRIDASPSEFLYFYGEESGPIHSNAPGETKCTVTWGEWATSTANSTIISRESVGAWRDEAFSILRGWQELYSKGSLARSVIDTAASSRVLVTLIQQDFSNGGALWELLGVSQ